MVDWSLARQIARLAAGAAGANGDDHDMDAARDELRAMAAELEPHVARYTTLELPADAPPAEALDRSAWAEVNVESLGRMLDPIGDRLAARAERMGPLAGALRMATGATLAAEAGLVVGYLATRVLGQYEVSLLEADESGPAPRLLFVVPNLRRAARELDVDRESFLRWIVLHELTHVLQFGGVPWLRPHLGSLLREYLATVEVRIEHGAAGGLPSLPDAAELVAAFREGGLAALVQTREQRKLMERIQATMALVEGYSEHVMDALAPTLVAEHEELRTAMERRRGSRSGAERVLQRLLGLDLKLRQYELGHRFCDEVVERAGIDALNRVWSGPEALPAMADLDQPARWVRRTEPPVKAALDPMAVSSVGTRA